MQCRSAIRVSGFVSLNALTAAVSPRRGYKWRKRMRAPANNPPRLGPRIGTKAYLQSEFPLPAIGNTAWASRGPKSLAGLIAYPVVPPKDMPIPHTRLPTKYGPSPTSWNADRGRPFRRDRRDNKNQDERGDHFTGEVRGSVADGGTGAKAGELRLLIRWSWPSVDKNVPRPELPRQMRQVAGRRSWERLWSSRRMPERIPR